MQASPPTRSAPQKTRRDSDVFSRQDSHGWLHNCSKKLLLYNTPWVVRKWTKWKTDIYMGPSLY